MMNETRDTRRETRSEYRSCPSRLASRVSRPEIQMSNHTQ